MAEQLERHADTGLLIYPPETPIAWFSGAIKAAAEKPGATEVFRRVRLWTPESNGRTLRQMLALADIALNELSKLFETPLVFADDDERWALYRGELFAPHERQFAYGGAIDDGSGHDHHHLVPEGFSLISRVKAIQPLVPLSVQQIAHIQDKQAILREQGRLSGPHIVSEEAHDGQLVSQLLPGGGTQLWYADIEPRFIEVS
ncbi:MAG TPA: hypothetical protein VLF69_03355 [Candidatus Saccharimonadales bacterium]|nr:hypothetical protein [Candidatus Saccharimonadales bacterium]